MKKTYLTFICFAFILFSILDVVAQNTAPIGSIENQIEGLSIYPNPVVRANHNHITIKSALNTNKKIEFYDVLGKRIFATILRGQQLNISNLNPGVYILKVTENNISEARKLVIK